MHAVLTVAAKDVGARSSGVQEFRSSGVQEFRSQEFRSSGVQEFRSSGVQEFREFEFGVRNGSLAIHIKHFIELLLQTIQFVSHDETTSKDIQGLGGLAEGPSTGPGYLFTHRKLSQK
jgi:hypothetical protein